MKGYILTYSGAKFWPLAPLARDVRLEDVAHALSQLCRFTGHCRHFYSVAQHCCGVADVLEQVEPGDRELHLLGLFHDAAEAYVADMSAPLKRSGDMGKYRAAEHRVQEAVEEHFGLSPTETRRIRVKWADLCLLATEARDLMPTREGAWSDLPRPWEKTVEPWGPLRAEQEFLDRAQRLLFSRTAAHRALLKEAGE